MQPSARVSFSAGTHRSDTGRMVESCVEGSFGPLSLLNSGSALSFSNTTATVATNTEKDPTSLNGLGPGATELDITQTSGWSMR